MECLSPEQMVSYLRGNGGDPRAVEAHARDCPACGMGLLLARETLAELKPPRAVKPPTRKMAVVRRKATWLPWAAAAAVFIVAILLVLQLGRPPAGPSDTATRRDPPPPPEAPKPPELSPAPPKPELPKSERPKPEFRPEVPAPAPEAPKPEAPRPEPPKPEPERPKPEPEKPKPEPEKPKPTVVERAVVARVTHAVGGPAGVVGRTLFAGDILATARQEFLSVALDGYGQLWFRENSKVEIGTGGELHLHDGAVIARIDSGRRMGLCKTPAADVEIHAPLFQLETSRQQGTEVSVVDGRAAVGAVEIKGPSMIAVRPGKAAEVRPLEAGFAGWIPDKLATKRFSGWIEGEAAQPMMGFRAMEMDGAAGARAAVQVEERATLGLKAPLPYKGRHILWLRVRQYVAKPVAIGLSLSGQPIDLRPFEGVEGKPWRWVGPIVVNSDKIELVLTALSRNPLRENDERRSFPVVLDAALLTHDPKFVPPDRIPEERVGYALVLEEPGK